MNKITLGGREIELYFNVKASMSIGERCGGDIANLADAFKDKNENQSLELICGVLCDLANGAVAKKNCNIAMGLEDGEKQPFYPEEFFLVNASVDKLASAFKVAFDTMGMGSEFTVPDNVKTEEKVIDLAEIEAEKNESKKS